MRHRVAEIRLDVARPDGVKRFGQPSDLRAPAFGFDESGDSVVEGHQSDAVSIGLGDPCEHQRRVDCMVELVQVARRRGHQAPAVERDHHLLATFCFHLDDDGAVAPRGGGPAHPPHVVPADVVAQTGECGGGAGRARSTHAHHRPEAAPQGQLNALDGNDVGKDGDLIRKLQPNLAAPPTIVPPHLQVDGAEMEGAAPR